MENKIRDFERTDWCGWGGAEMFKGNKAPLIYEAKLSGGKAEITVIGDANGISLYILSEDEDDMMSWHYNKSMTKLKVEGEMRAMIKEFDLDNEPYGPDVSYCLDHTTKWDFEYYEC